MVRWPLAVKLLAEDCRGFGLEGVSEMTNMINRSKQIQTSVEMEGRTCRGMKVNPNGLYRAQARGSGHRIEIPQHKHGLSRTNPRLGSLRY